MSSVDGKILVDRWSAPSGEVSKGELMGVYSELGNKLHTDAWTFGKNTITEKFPEKFTPKTKISVQRERSIFKGRRLSSRMFISIDPDADIIYPSRSFRGDDILVVVGGNASSEYLALLKDLDISYVIVNDISDFRDIFGIICKEFGVASVSLQGGGILNAAMLRQGVIDELSIVVYPGIDGTNDSRSIFDYIGTGHPAEGQSLQIIDVERKKGGVIWLRYKILPSHSVQLEL